MNFNDFYRKYNEQILNAYQPNEADILTTDNWQAYLNHIAVINKAIDQQNKKILKTYKFHARQYAKKINSVNRMRDAKEKAYQDKQNAAACAYDALPWYKKWRAELPDRYRMSIHIPYNAYNQSPIYWAIPLLMHHKKPLFEDFLTWQIGGIHG
jgi:hypothetical protein